MRLLRTLADLRAHAGSLGKSPTTGGVLVPTMGALHDGHGALIRAGVAEAVRRREPAGCLVTIFVNPTQFADPADLARYPRTLDDDLALCERSGAAAVFAPDVESVYPPDEPGAAPPVPLPAVATEPGLEDAHRPGHFAGVCRVVARLFRLLGPSAAVFGEKDWQQLQVVRAMTESLGLPVDIVAHPTVREPDGLAMSSRNRFLSMEERSRARALHRALGLAARERDRERAEALMRETLRAAGAQVEYAVVREARTLRPLVNAPETPVSARALVAAVIGATRLIDNAPWPWGDRPSGGGAP